MQLLRNKTEPASHTKVLEVNDFHGSAVRLSIAKPRESHRLDEYAADQPAVVLCHNADSSVIVLSEDAARALAQTLLEFVGP